MVHIERHVSRSSRFHPAWRMVAISAAALLASGSFTTIAGLITDPLVRTEGWSRTSIGIGVAINMVLYGAVAPFSAALMDRFGLRSLTATALSLLAASAVLLIYMTPSVALFAIWWGVLVGVGTGAVTMVFGALVAQRWFAKNIGLASGILTAASVVGQFAMLPLLSTAMGKYDWRTPVLTCGAMTAAAAVLVAIALRDWPSDVHVARYGQCGAISPPPLLTMACQPQSHHHCLP